MGINPRGGTDAAPVANDSISCGAILKVAMVSSLGSLTSKPFGEPDNIGECAGCAAEK